MMNRNTTLSVVAALCLIGNAEATEDVVAFAKEFVGENYIYILAAVAGLVVVFGFAASNDSPMKSISEPEEPPRNPAEYTTAEKKVLASFPKAMTNSELIRTLKATLKPFGYGSNSLVATSLCCDEVNRVLDEDLAGVFGDNFSMGGLAGFAFGGVTSFGAMAHHIPAGGSCLIVYGPHVGVDADGNVGKINRRGRSIAGPCCGSAAAACTYCTTPGAKPPTGTDDPLDAQQAFVSSQLLPYANRLINSTNVQVELPMALFDAQKELMDRIVKAGCGEVHSPGTIALLGGIQINTPRGTPDYFLPLSFELRDNKAQMIQKFV